MTRMGLSWWMGLVGALVAQGCGGADDPAAPTTSASQGGSGGDGGDGGGGGAPPFQLSVEWQPCALDSDGAGTDAECATVAVPLDWDEPAGATIELFVKRYPVFAEPPEIAIWNISGGPGYSGQEWDKRLKNIAAAMPGTQLYVPDHRGTGRSTRLTCEAEEAPDSEAGLDIAPAEWPACLASLAEQWGDKLAGFSIDNAARDVGQLVAHLHTNGERVLLNAQSYGTTLAQRFFHHYPDAITGALLDGLTNPGYSFTHYDLRADGVGRKYLSLCGDDPLCQQKLGNDPVSFALGVFDDVYGQGKCAEVVGAGLDRPLLQKILFATLLFAEYRTLGPAILYRLDRCAAGDVAALTHLIKALTFDAPPSTTEQLFSEVLHHHVALSEMWDDDPPSPQAQQAELDSLMFAVGGLEEAGLYASWPRYGKNGLTSTLPATKSGLAMFNGDLDPATPIEGAKETGDHFTGENQTFVTVKGATHGAIGSDATDSGLPCTVGVAVAFVNEPDKAPDVACVASIDLVTFEPQPVAAKLFFGTTDAWDDTAKAAGTEGVAPTAAERALFQRRVRMLRHPW